MPKIYLIGVLVVAGLAVAFWLGTNSHTNASHTLQRPSGSVSLAASLSSLDRTDLRPVDSHAPARHTLPGGAPDNAPVADLAFWLIDANGVLRPLHIDKSIRVVGKSQDVGFGVEGSTLRVAIGTSSDPIVDKFLLRPGEQYQVQLLPLSPRFTIPADLKSGANFRFDLLVADERSALTKN